MDSEAFRRAREFLAWTLLAAAAIQVFMGRGPGGCPEGPASYHSGSIFAPTVSPPFWFRGQSAIGFLVPVSVTALPVAAVLPIALTAGHSGRRVMQPAGVP